MKTQIYHIEKEFLYIFVTMKFFGVGGGGGGGMGGCREKLGT